MKTTQKGFIIPLLLIIVAILLAGGGAYIYTNSEFTLQEKGTPDSANKDVALPQATTTAQTSNTQTKVVSQLVLDLAGVTPQFIDDGGNGKYTNGSPLPDYVINIKKDIKVIPIFRNALNNTPESVKEVYLIAIGKRYVLLHMPGGKETGTDVVFDSVTQQISDEIGYWTPILFKTNKIAVYLHPNDICTYTLDQSSCVPLAGAKLSGNELYWSSDQGGDYVDGVWKTYMLNETHTNSSFTISVFDWNTQVGKSPIDPKTGLLMPTKIRDVTFVLPITQTQNSNPNMGGGLCSTGQVWSGPINSGKCIPQTAPTGISLPATCKIAGSAGDIDPSNGIKLEKDSWLINCGSANNGNARGTMEPVLKQQGWAFCDSGLATASWWKDGIATYIAESGGISYPFKIVQSQGARCSGN